MRALQKKQSALPLLCCVRLYHNINKMSSKRFSGFTKIFKTKNGSFSQFFKNVNNGLLHFFG